MNSNLNIDLETIDYSREFSPVKYSYILVDTVVFLILKPTA